MIVQVIHKIYNNDFKKTSKTFHNKFFYYSVLIPLLFFAFFMANTKYMLYKYNFKVNVTNNIVKTINTTYANESRSDYKAIQEMKYILLWTNKNSSPFIYFGRGQSVFVKKNCKWTNCFVTEDRNYLGFYTEFDVIAFNGPQLSATIYTNDLPGERSTHQKYVYANIESAANYPVPNKLWNGYFNWTWTYKLDSDSIWGYLTVKNATNDVIGPNIDMNWLKLSDMDPIDIKLKEKLKTKEKAAVWFSSNCHTQSLREDYVRQIQKALALYNLQVDIYGTCGTHQCPRNVMDRCLKYVEKHYYFYFAFENAFSEDYVTEKIVYPLKHNTVPVVFGGANYSRFMPQGIYLNALELGPEGLAKKMNEIIQNPAEYHNYFRWKKYYSFHFRHESPDTDDYCQFCAMINDQSLVKTTTVYNHFDSWWKTNISFQFDKSKEEYTR